MFVYLHSASAVASANHVMSVAPAADLPEQDPPEEWLDPEGRPLTFPIVFTFGKAEVPENIGRLMLKRGWAERRPTSSWMA